jgi:hypothetical protein
MAWAEKYSDEPIVTEDPPKFREAEKGNQHNEEQHRKSQ